EGTEPEPVQPQAPPEAKDAPPARQPVLVGYGVKPGSTSRRPRKKTPTRPGSYPATPSAPPTGGAPLPPAGTPGGSPANPVFPVGIKLPPGIPAPPGLPRRPGEARALPQ